MRNFIYTIVDYVFFAGGGLLLILHILHNKTFIPGKTGTNSFHYFYSNPTTSILSFVTKFEVIAALCLILLGLVIRIWKKSR